MSIKTKSTVIVLGRKKGACIPRACKLYLLKFQLFSSILQSPLQMVINTWLPRTPTQASRVFCIAVHSAYKVRFPDSCMASSSFSNCLFSWPSEVFLGHPIYNLAPLFFSEAPITHSLMDKTLASLSLFSNFPHSSLNTTRTEVACLFCVFVCVCVEGVRLGTGSHRAAHAGLDLVILPPLGPEH